MNLYPLKFEPVYHHRLWAGNQLATHLKRNPSIELAGESWELCGLQGQESVVNNGLLKGQNLRELIQYFKSELVGQKVYDQFADEFPLLIKFIATAKPLSVQVHPNDDLAEKRHNSFGKNEMWYIMQTEPESEIIYGFKEGTTKEKYLQELAKENLESILNYTTTKPNDVYYMPTGTVHAIGKGILLAEIQQSSDVTYRIYDYNRLDVDGKKRELHTDLALEAINFDADRNFFNHESKVSNHAETIVKSDYFNTEFLQLNQTKILDIGHCNSFMVVIALKGEGNLSFGESSCSYRLGETILIPAMANELTFDIQSDSEFLLVSIP